jgi:hypothetical protein
VIGPTLNGESRSPFVRVGHVEDCDGGEVGVNGDRDILAQIASLACERQPLAGAKRIRHTVPVACAQGEVTPGADARHRFRRGKRS